MDEKEKLEKEIRDAKRKLEILESKNREDKRSSIIKSLGEYTVDEKVKFFDKLYGNALRELNEIEKHGYSNEDNTQFAWEEYIQILAIDNGKFWDYWNKLYQ